MASTPPNSSEPERIPEQEHLRETILGRHSAAEANGNRNQDKREPSVRGSDLGAARVGRRDQVHIQKHKETVRIALIRGATRDSLPSKYLGRAIC